MKGICNVYPADLCQLQDIRRKMTHGKALLHYGVIHRSGSAASSGGGSGRVVDFVKSWAIRFMLVVVAVALAAESRHHLPAYVTMLHLHF
jgi:hypothetical protein